MNKEKAIAEGAEGKTQAPVPLRDYGTRSPYRQSGFPASSQCWIKACNGRVKRQVAITVKAPAH